jgi:hypothetical protein
MMHLGLWTRPDVMPSIVRLARYQSAPGEPHFKGLQHVLWFLQAHCNRGLMYRRPSDSLLHLKKKLEGFSSPVVGSISGPDFLVASKSVSVLYDEVAMSSEPDEVDLNFNDVLMPCVSSLSAKVIPSKNPLQRNMPPSTDGFVDAGFGSVYETVGFTGACVLISGTAFWWLSKKQATLAYSTTESELTAATDMSKFVKWLRVLMADIGLPYHSAIVVGEDNDAARQIGHAGKVTRNVRHVVIQTAGLQETIASLVMALRRVGSGDNRADHFTKLLPAGPFWFHTDHFMGVRFLTPAHLVAMGFDPADGVCKIIPNKSALMSFKPEGDEKSGLQSSQSKQSVSFADKQVGP